MVRCEAWQKEIYSLGLANIRAALLHQHHGLFDAIDADTKGASPPIDSISSTVPERARPSPFGDLVGPNADNAGTCR